VIEGAALGFINHLLAGEGWALERLKVFAGRRARLEFGALALPLTIGADGLFVADANSEAPDVTITLAADAPLRALTESASLLASAQISGAADLAENLAFVFRNLSWDVESDVSFFVGDIAARRIVSGGRRFFDWQKAQAKNFAENVVEYLTEENPTIARAREVSAFGAEVERLHEDLKRLEARVERVENSRKT
jgi:ubiquinone biosynthesis protein UbiJ